MYQQKIWESIIVTTLNP